MKLIGIIGLILNIIGAIFAFLGTSLNATGINLTAVGISPLGSIGFAIILVSVGSIFLSFRQKD